MNKTNNEIEERMKEIWERNKFGGFQMHEIRYGLEQGLDVDVYAKPEFNWEQMQQIRLGLEDGLDVSIYAKPEFNLDQMFQIRIGLKQGLNASYYAKPELDAIQMFKIKLKLMQDLYSEKLITIFKYGNDEDKISLNIDDNDNLKIVNENKDTYITNITSKYFNGFSFTGAENYRILKRIIEYNNNISKIIPTQRDIERFILLLYSQQYANTCYMNYNNILAKVNELKLDINDIMNYQINKDHIFNDRQIDQIRYGLEQGLDVDVYAKPEYDHRQMQQIRLGLIEGLEVEKYIDPKLDWKQMQQIRIELENNSIE